MIKFKIGIFVKFGMSGILVTGDSLIKNENMKGYLDLQLLGNTIMLIDQTRFKLKFYNKNDDGIFYKLSVK